MEGVYIFLRQLKPLMLFVLAAIKLSIITAQSHLFRVCILLPADILPNKPR